MQRKWLTVSKNNPCVRCARFDWCALSADGKIVVCRRDDSGGIHKTDSSGADYWVYATDDALDIQTVVLPQLPDKEERTRAAPVDLDRVYRALLDRLTLSDHHLEQLRGRGLSDAAIKRRLYRTMPRNGRCAGTVMHADSMRRLRTAVRLRRY